MQVERDALRQQIDHAFRDMPMFATIAEMLAAPYKDNEDAYELAAALHGRCWLEVPTRELFLHRAMLFALAPQAFRAYLPAYLVAVLATDDPLDLYGADLNHDVLASLIVEPGARADRLGLERLVALDPVQRDVVVAVVRYLEDRWRMKRADDAIRALTSAADLLREALRNDIERAFRDVPMPATLGEMLAVPYKTSEDAYELATALFGRAWFEVPILELFRHREMLFALTPRAYRAYLPAYLVAVLAADDPCDRYGADLDHYLLASLIAEPGSRAELVTTTQARLAALDPAQRDVTVAVVRYLEARWRVKRADDAIRAVTAADG